MAALNKAVNDGQGMKQETDQQQKKTCALQVVFLKKQIR
jgi:hypothetical protein